MKHKCSDLPEKAWVSRFWAQYNQLPETYKKSFADLAQNLVKETGKQGGGGNGYSIPYVSGAC